MTPAVTPPAVSGDMVFDAWAAEFYGRAVKAGIAPALLEREMAGLTLTRNLEDVARVHAYLRERGCGRLILLGSSMGGGTALWYSALHPEEVVAGLHIAPALEMEKGLLAWAGPERTRVWEETGTIPFKNDLVACDLGWGLIEDLRAHPTGTLLAS